jgi:hypothetical protein
MHADLPPIPGEIFFVCVGKKYKNGKKQGEMLPNFLAILDFELFWPKYFENVFEKSIKKATSQGVMLPNLFQYWIGGRGFFGPHVNG